MRRWLAVLALCATATTAAAAPAMQRLTIDRVDLEPSPMLGFARLRVLVSALDLSAAGKVIDVIGEHAWRLQIGGEVQSMPYMAGYYGGADLETAIVIVVQTSPEYGKDLATIKQALDDQLLTKLPATAQVAVIGYGEQVLVGKLGTAKAAQQKLDGLQPDAEGAPPTLLMALDKAIGLLKKVKTDPENVPVRKIILVVSDGRDKDDDPTSHSHTKVDAIGNKALKAGIRIDTIGYLADNEWKGPLLNLGQLSKISLATFRWAQQDSSIAQRVQNAELELEHQYVLTALVAPDDVAGKKISVIAQVSASQSLTSNDAKIPVAASCAGAECPTDGYCALDRCVQRAKPKGTGALGWILIILGVGLGGVIVVGLVGVVLMRVRRKPKPMPYPMPGAQPGAAPPGAAPAAPGFAPAPAPVAPPQPAVVVGPQLYVMGGPRAGQRLGLRHGFLIGKQPGCDLVLEDDGFASSQHAQILMDAGGNCTLVDKGSTNGTFVNGVRVTQYALTHGVAIRCGSTELRFLAQ